ncbi:MAG: hypothetical protein LUC91_01140 [Prevotella sp.]|nr:hypothetical protein [Prevotella sp.]
MKIQRKQGNETLLERKKTVFLCSRMEPDAVRVAVEKWLDGLSPDVDCVMCGSHSQMERVVFERLLKDKIPAILVLAEALYDRWDAPIEAALREGRLLIITHCDDNVHSVSSRSAFDRNLLMLSLAENIVVGFCKKGGNLERVLVGFDNVTYLFVQQEKPKRKTVLGNISRHAESNGNSLNGNGLWSKSGSFENGNITIEVNGFGKETYLKIIQKDESSPNGSLGERLTFSRSEFASFYHAIKQIKDTFNASEESHDSVIIKSDSGDVTIDFIPDDNCGTWVFTQSKVLVNKALHRHTIKLQTTDFLAFYELLSSAASYWRL